MMRKDNVTLLNSVGSISPSSVHAHCVVELPVRSRLVLRQTAEGSPSFNSARDGVSGKAGKTILAINSKDVRTLDTHRVKQ